MSISKTLSVALLLVSSIALTGQAQANSNWYTIVTCDGARVDVDANARTNLQLVVTDPSSVEYLVSTLHACSDFYSENYEATFSGTQPNGVFAPTDFKGATKTYSHGNYPYEMGSKVLMSYTEYTSFFFPNESDRSSLKVSVTRANISYCSNYDFATGICNGTYQVANEDDGSRTFGNCR